MDIGRKIYYETLTGNTLVDTGERSGSVIETTEDQDFEVYTALQGRVKDTVGCLQLDYGQLASNFSTCYGFRVDITKNPIDTSAIIFNMTPPEASLSDVKNAKITQLQDLYNQTRTSGFKSAGNGITYSFRYGQVDQIEFLKLMVGANSGLITFPIGVPANEGIAIYTKDQLTQLFLDASAFDQSTSTKFQTLKTEILACTTVDQVNAIVISFS